jgi:ribose 5-phosphate isomerase A
MNTDHLKKAAGYYAVDTYVQSGMRLGLGHGSTMAPALVRLGERVRKGELQNIVGVPVSDHTLAAARRHGIPITTLEAAPTLDLYIDGADEVDPSFRLIKGLGGALLREKIIANAARQMIVICDETKVVSKLGTKAPLPVEVLTFGWTTHEHWLQTLGCVSQPRMTDDGDLFLTDGGNYIYDCRFPDGIQNPGQLEVTLNNRPGVVENGLFLNLADEVVIATTAEGILVRKRS